MGRDDARIPPKWPKEYSTKFNLTNPILVNYNDSYKFNTYISVGFVNWNNYINNADRFILQSSPPPMSPKGRTQDIDAIVDVIKSAEEYVHIAVMDYFPLILYSHKIKQGI